MLVVASLQRNLSDHKFISSTLFLFVFLFAIECFGAGTQKAKYVVAYAQDTMTNDWRAAQVQQLEEGFAKYPGIKFIFTDANGSTAKQVQDIEDLVYQKVDVLMTSPRDMNLMTPVISKTYKSGIPVVLVTRRISNDDFTSFVAPDDRDIARQAARYIAKKLNGKGRVFMLQGVPTATTAIMRTEGFLEEIKKYPGIKVVAIKTANYLRSDAVKVTDELIASGIEFDALYAQSDSMASGARLAMVKSGINPVDKIIVGIDYISEAKKAIIEGHQSASFLYPTSASQAVQVVLKILNNKKVPRHVRVDSRIITKNNVHAVDPIF
ncbi:MAG: substrate-binding domain-containing protein [Gammaproteobacteria bacterium]|nr:substrate-binding domain-containing protein [Gammaproteobacteria bacterium]